MFYSETSSTAVYSLPPFSVSFLSKGWGITVARAMPSNAVIFFTYEKVSKLIRKAGGSDDNKPV